MKVPANAKYELVYSITDDRHLGWLIEPYIVQVTSGGTLALVNQKIHSGNADFYDRRLDEVDYKAIELLDDIRPEQITKSFSPVQKIRPKEFFTKHLTKEQLDKEIRPFVESVLAKVMPIIHGRNLYINDNGNPAHRKLEWTDQESTVLFHLRRNDDNTHYFATIKCGDERLAYYRKSLMLSVKPCIMVADDKLIYFKPEFDGKKIRTFLQKKFILIPKDTEEKYFSGFIAPLVEENPIYAVGLDVITQSYQASPQINLVESGDSHALGLRFRYDEHLFPYSEGKKISVKIRKKDDGYTFIRIKRSVQWERNQLDALLGFGLKQVTDDLLVPVSNNGIAPPSALEWIHEHREQLTQMGFTVGRETQKKYHLVKPSIEMEVDEQNDWFDVRTIVRFGEFDVPFSDIVPLIRKGERELRLPNGEIAIIPEEWLTELSNLLELSTKRTNIRLKKHHVGLLAGMHGRMRPVNAGQLVDRFAGISEIPVPEGFRGELRAYQKAGYNWFYFLKEFRFGGVLADDMGLGKTIQTLVLLQNEKEIMKKQAIEEHRPLQLDIFSNEPSSAATSLLIVPTSLIHNWVREAKKFTPGLNVLIHRGQNRSTEITHFVNYDVVISTYGTVRNDEDILRDFMFHYIILDESQYIKNPGSKVAQSVNKLRSSHRLTLTGTPIENSINDLWSQMNFLNKGLLGSYRYFQKTFVQPIEKMKDEKAVEQLQRMIKPFVLRRTKKQVATDLPDKLEQVIYCDMTEEQEAIYEEVKSAYRNSILEAIDDHGIGKSRIQIIKGLVELRQIANHPVFVRKDYDGESGKTEEIVRMIETAVDEGHKILIFSQFVKHLKLVLGLIEDQGYAYCYLDGSTTSKERQSEVDRFQKDPSVSIFLISLKAGGVGLNLTEADYVFLLDPWWNPAAESQAIDRSHRIGQQKHVFSYKFITLNTVEEKILKLQDHKKHLSESLITIDESFVKKLTKEDIANIFD